MKWGYKTVHFELKKEGLLSSGFLDESEIEEELNEFGRNGWELVSVLEVHDGIIVFFKQQMGQAAVISAPRYDEHERAESFPEQEPDETSVAAERSDAGNAEEAVNSVPTGEDGSPIGAIRIE